MKKKVLVSFTGAMELGGVERSLLGLLDAIDYTQYDVDLFLYAHHGPLMPLINKNVHILPEVKDLAYLRESFGTKLRHGCYYSAWKRITDEIKSKFMLVDHDATWAKIMDRCTPKSTTHYDVALGFFRPFDYIVEKVDASVKIGWIHTDYTAAGENLDFLVRDYDMVDYIAAVSDSCAQSFIQVLPQFKSKVITIENILPRTLIKQQAGAFTVEQEMPDDGSIKLLSIGRFSDAKNFDNVPDICRRLLAEGLNVRWYLVGYGGDEALIRRKIAEAGMEGRVVILGKKENPYPYIRACDLYAQPSRYEGKAVTVREAQMLCKPVVITRYATSASQLEEGVDGVIVPLDNVGCAAGIAQLLRSPERMEQLSRTCAQRDYTNAGEVEKIYQLIEG